MKKRPKNDDKVDLDKRVSAILVDHVNIEPDDVGTEQTPMLTEDQKQEGLEAKEPGTIYVKSITSARGSVTIFEQSGEASSVQKSTFHSIKMEDYHRRQRQQTFKEQYRSSGDPTKESSTAALRIISQSPIHKEVKAKPTPNGPIR